MLRANPGGQLSSTQPLAHFLTPALGREKEEKKQENLGVKIKK